MGRSFKAVVLCAFVCLSASAVGAVHETGDARAASRVYSVKECFATISWGRIPLRQGNRDFGYRHIEQRRGYTPAMRQMIRRTLLFPTTYEPLGDLTVFRRYRPGVIEVVVVGFNRIPYDTTGNRIVGIITAYEVRGKMRRRGFPPPNVGVDATDVSVCPG